MAPVKPPVPELETERIRVRGKTVIVNQLCMAFATFVRWAGASVFMYFAYRTIDSLAGKHTEADIAIAGNLDMKFLANRYASQIFFFIFGTGGIVYGLGQRRLYVKVVEKLGRLEQFERQLDPKRSGSGLNHGARTNSEDAL